MSMSLGIGLGLTFGGERGIRPPLGFAFFIKPDGTYWTNTAGAYYLKAVA